MENIIGSLLILGIIVALNVFMFKMLWYGIRSILKKTVNLPPSHAGWLRTRADVLDNDYVKGYQVRYYVDNVEYTAVIGGFTIYGNKALIYVNRNDHKIVKEFIPKPPLDTAAALACLFLAAMIIVLEFALFFG